ncbi:MAG: response regulator [Candidatus Rokubacteria bacterium]|nr:response regulator [Candidatus Rokubacteria bacterium]
MTGGESDPGGAAACLVGVRVLVVDADADVRDLVVEMLVGRGATVISTGTAVQALELVQRERPDVLVSGIYMAGNNGFWLIRMIRAMPSTRGAAIPAIAFTGGADAAGRDLILASGYDACLAKPSDLGRLAEVVARLRPGARPSARPAPRGHDGPEPQGELST